LTFQEFLAQNFYCHRSRPVTVAAIIKLLTLRWPIKDFGTLTDLRATRPRDICALGEKENLKFKGNEKFAFDWLSSARLAGECNTFFFFVLSNPQMQKNTFSEKSSRQTELHCYRFPIYRVGQSRGSGKRFEIDQHRKGKSRSLVHIPLLSTLGGIFIQLTKYFLQISILQSQT
jgi:hypothetical protein